MKKVKLLASLFFFGLISEVLFAKEFNVTVIDKEIELPLEGVVISIDSIEQTWETDENGEINISIPDTVFDNKDTLTLSAYMPGYAKSKIRINSKTEDLIINLSIEEVLEGKELVVEQEAYQQTDAKSGVSVVITKDQFDTASMIGSIPDVMTAVKTLPGVTYMGSFSQQPSIRGAYPYEMAAVLDGMYVYSPFHWKGMVSIFDPQFTESVKLSHGIFSAKYGHATAGLLDITTVSPEDESIKFNASASDIITDGVIQLPITDKIGLIGGYRVSYYDTVPWFLDNLGITQWAMKQSYSEEDMTPEEEEFINNFKISNYLEMPNMQDFYVKFYYNPTDRLHITINEFYGNEGIGLHIDEDSTIKDKDDIENTPTHYSKYLQYYEISNFGINITWKNVFHFGSINFQLLPTDKLQINARAGYNSYSSAVIMEYISNDEIEYTQHNIERENKNLAFDPESMENNSETLEKDTVIISDYNLDQQKIEKYSFIYEDSYRINVLQGKASADYSYNSTNLFSFGIEEFYKTRTSYNSFSLSQYSKEYQSRTYNDTQVTEVVRDNEIGPDTYTLGLPPVEGNQVLNSVAYTSWEFGDKNSFLQGEAGFRFEHYYVFNKAPNARKKISLSSTPTWNPRVTIHMKPQKEYKDIENLTFTAGLGMFSELNDDTMKLTTDYEIVGGIFKPDQNIFGILGTSFSFLDNFTFQIEGYYKYYLNRFYSVGVLTNSNIIAKLINEALTNKSSSDYINKAFFDGTGHIFGFDTMLQKKTGRYFDGYICYSFIFSKYLNPFQPPEPEVDSEEESEYTQKLKTDSDDPLGNWYYPYFHRFHTFSMVLNYRPTNDFVVTLTGSVCSGVPIDQDSIWNEIAGTLTEEKRTRTSVSFPINFRIGKSGYYKTTKLQYEWFAGIENILGFMNKDSLLGAINSIVMHPDKEDMYIYAERLANFDTGIPTVSIGLRMSM